MATTWPIADRLAIEALIQESRPDLVPIQWVSLNPGESWASVVDRRGGVDLILGVPSAEIGRLADLGKLIPFDPADPELWWILTNSTRSPALSPDRTKPRDDAPGFESARATLLEQGWPAGYESLIRRAIGERTQPDPGASAASTSRIAGSKTLALVNNGRNLPEARRWIDVFERRGLATRPMAQSRNEANGDVLLDDLLNAALVDPSSELRDLGAALDRGNHPARAESALGERPPWPPASILKLREGPNGESLVETLLEQVAPDRPARDWLRQSWAKPRREIDGNLLGEIAGAVDGQLVREPRFRAWLRGEWTAWTRQLYRRVARLAGGYLPS